MTNLETIFNDVFSCHLSDELGHNKNGCDLLNHGFILFDPAECESCKKKTLDYLLDGENLEKAILHSYTLCDIAMKYVFPNRCYGFARLITCEECNRITFEWLKKEAV